MNFTMLFLPAWIKRKLPAISRQPSKNTNNSLEYIVNEIAISHGGILFNAYILGVWLSGYSKRQALADIPAGSIMIECEIANFLDP